MKTSLLNLDLPAEQPAVRSAPPPAKSQEKPQPQPKPIVAESPAQEASEPTGVPSSTKNAGQEEVDFELVFGRRQLASTGLLLMVVLAVFSGTFYLAGKAAGSKAAEVALNPEGSATVASAEPANSLAKEAAGAATPAQSPLSGPRDQPPVFADAISGEVYIQVGAVEKGLAGIWAEGLRAHGLQAIASPGPSDKIWRVSVGPLPDPQAYQRAKNVLDALGIATFGKRHIDDPAVKTAVDPPPPAPEPQN